MSTLLRTLSPAYHLLLVLLLAAAVQPVQAQKGDAAPRQVAPRGALGADELATIDVFKRISPSVVHITTLATERDFFNRAVQQVPRGTGTGFVWDGSGHIVTPTATWRC